MAEKIVAEKAESHILPAKARDYVLETIIDATINTSTPCKIVDVSGFRKFSLLGRFEGKASAKIRFEVNNNNLLVTQEIFNIEAGGWFNFAKVYDVFAPTIGVVIYEFPPNLKVKMYLYAGY